MCKTSGTSILAKILGNCMIITLMGTVSTYPCWVDKQKIWNPTDRVLRAVVLFSGRCVVKRRSEELWRLYCQDSYVKDQWRCKQFRNRSTHQLSQIRKKNYNKWVWFPATESQKAGSEAHWTITVKPEQGNVIPCVINHNSKAVWHMIVIVCCHRPVTSCAHVQDGNRR